MKFDTFEDEKEVSALIKKLQNDGRKYMQYPDDFWDTRAYEKAVKSANDIAKKVMSSL